MCVSVKPEKVDVVKMFLIPTITACFVGDQ